MTADSDARLDRERDFHNQRFETEDTRQDQLKYYWAIKDGAEAYMTGVVEMARGRDVLEYGCGDADNYRQVSPGARSLSGIDISDQAIARLEAANTFANTRYAVMDAQAMTFDAASFDVVFGSGIIHHLDTEKAAREISRVLRADGTACFWEPLGLNPVINLYRLVTPSARTPDEHPLLPVDFDIMRRHFGKVDLTFYGLTTIGAVPFRNKGVGKPLFDLTRGIDRVLMSMPGLRFLAWYALITCRDPIRAQTAV